MSALVTTSRRLSRLRADLNRLRHRRAALRLGIAASAIGLVIIGAIVTAFLADCGLNLSPLQRGCALIGIVCVSGWTVSRIVRRWVGVHENVIDVALMVERRHGLDRDLVAALQFQSDDAARWGSPRLEQAVVDEAEKRSDEIDALAGFSWKPLPGRFVLLATAAAAIAFAAVRYPAHSSAFMRRLVLADVPYPTRTQIESLSINGQRVALDETAPLRAPAGQPLVFSATWAGATPRTGIVRLTGDSGATTDVALQVTDDSTAYAGALESIAEPLTFTLRLGDDETRPRRIETVPLPVVSLDILPTPPKYARNNAPAAPPSGVRTAFVLQGSSIALRVQSGNKPLQRVEAILTSEDATDRQTISLKPAADRMAWTLEPVSTAPFADVQEPLSFAINVIDDDGLSPDEPLTGSIRLRQDRAPRVSASAVVRRVLPAGRPELAYRASDDFGIKSVKARLTIRHEDGSETEHFMPLPIEQSAIAEVMGSHPLDLASLQLRKGDRAIVTVIAEDVRGERAGQITSSEPITFDVTDREGLLSGLLESDEEGAERLDAIIERELGIGAQQ